MALASTTAKWDLQNLDQVVVELAFGAPEQEHFSGIERKVLVSVWRGSCNFGAMTKMC